MWYFGFKNFILIERKFSILEYDLTFYLFEALKDPAFTISLKMLQLILQLIASCKEPQQVVANNTIWIDISWTNVSNKAFDSEVFDSSEMKKRDFQNDFR